MVPVAGWLHALGKPIDGAWLAALRIAFGLTMCVSMLRFIGYGWVERLLVLPSFHFKYYGFSWVTPLPDLWMLPLFWGLAGLALAMAAGLAYRVATPLFALGLSYIQLIDVSNYLNHYYLAALLAWLLSVAPAHHNWSFDSWLKRKRRNGDQSASIPIAWLWLFRFQVGVVYFFAGIAKAHPDWLLHAQPLRTWLGASTDLPLIGPLLVLPWVPMVFSWSGFLFDTTIIAWLLIRRTRLLAFGAVVVFHVMTRMLFPIGMFPVIMVISVLCFFDPDWPRIVMQRLGWKRAQKPLVFQTAGTLRSPLWCLVPVYCALQICVPLRSVLYDGDVLWHEQGMRFSWRVMLRAKGGSTTFIVTQRASERVWHISPREYLTQLQESEMSSQPDLILQLAHHIEQDFERRGLGAVEVRVQARAALNGRRAAPLINPAIDLAQVCDGLGQATWILPAPTEAPRATQIVL